jgi:hypothetical protein
VALLVVSVVSLGLAASAAALPSKFYGLHFSHDEKSPRAMKIVGKSGAEYYRVNFSPSMTHADMEVIFDLAWQNGFTILPDVYGGQLPGANACAEVGNGWRDLVWYLATYYGPGGGFWSGPRASNPKPVEAIEIWNEPNRGKNGPDEIKAAPVQTARFVNGCADLIHGATPATKVIMGGLLNVKETNWKTDEDKVSRYNYTVTDFLQAAKIGEPQIRYDGVALHPYVFEPKEGEAIYERTGKVITTGREAVSAFVSAGTPIWITELGWPSWGEDSNHATVYEPNRATVLQDTFTWIVNHQVSYGIQSLIYYNARDWGGGGVWDQRSGLLYQQPPNTGVDDNGNVLGSPYSLAVFKGAWTTFKSNAGGDVFYPYAPVAATNGATFVTANSARLLGYYNARELQSEYQFEWGPTTAYGNSTPRQNAGFDNSNHDVVLPGEEKWGQLITGLSPNTTYHFRLVVRNENGQTAYGADQTFTTKEPPPVTTKPATAVNQLDAVLNGTVNPKEEVTDYYFEYGPSTAYGSTTPATRAGYGNETVEVHDEIAGLQYGVTYHFRVVATNYLGTSKGEDRTFTPTYKGPAPAVSTRPVSQLGDTSATLNGYLSPNGLETKTYFEYGPTTAYGSKTPEVSAGSGSTTLAKSAAVTKLNPNVLYHYRMVATNSSGTTQGADRTFLPGWTVQPSSKTPGFLEDVSCVSATDCMAVGHSGQWAFVQNWNGSEWIEQPVEKPAGATATALTGVSCTSSSTCFAVGYYVNASSNMVALAEKLDGSEWKVVGSENPAGSVIRLEDVSCAGPSECVAVGSYFVSEDERTLIERWGGTAWKIEASKNGSASDNRLNSVSCPSSSFCMAVGFYYDTAVSAWLPLTESWSGSSWTQHTAAKPTGSTNSYFNGVSCTSEAACTAVGEWIVNAQTVSEYTLAERWNGSTWVKQTTPNPPSGALDIADVSCTTSSACTAVGSYVDPLSVEHPIAIASSDGTSWAMQSPPLPAGDQKVHPTGVSCVVSLGCEAVGYHRTAAGPFLTFAAGYWRSPPPTASTAGATSIGDSAATLNGSVNPNGSETNYLFEYGTTASYGSKTSEASAGSGSSPVEKSQAVGALSPSTTYHYRVVATNENPDPANGADQTFRTTGPPTVSIGAAVPDPNGTAATLNATINPNGHDTTYQFEYGKNTLYGNKAPVSPASIGSGTSPVNVSEALTGLEPGTTYYYRVAATNESGTVNSEGKTFKTESASGVPTQLDGMAVTEPFDGSAASLARFSSSWSTLGWASGTTPKGEASTSGWRPVNAYPAVAGTYYNPVIADTGSGVAAVATMAINPAGAGRYFSLWLDMPTPGSASRDGYGLRFTYTATNTYTVSLAKWQNGIETVLGAQSGYTFVNGSSVAIVDAGSTVSAWTSSGSGFSQLLSATDSTFASGNAGLEGSGNITRITKFKAGALLTPVAGMDAALKSLPVRDAFSTNENPLSGGGAWAALSWANSTSGHNTGWVSGGWGPYDAFSTINGAYWQKAPFADSGAGAGVVATLKGNPTIASRYFSLWLNMPGPNSARTGYELRFTETSTNTYEVAIAKWQAGTKTTLASKSGYSFPTNSQFALVEKAGTVSAWTNTAGEYKEVLSAADSSLSNGYTGVEASGNITRLTNFSAGQLPPF